MIDRIIETVKKIPSLVYFKLMLRGMENTKQVLMGMPPQEAIEWIDQNIKDGKALAKEMDCDEADEIMDFIHGEYLEVRRKKVWELYLQK